MMCILHISNISKRSNCETHIYRKKLFYDNIINYILDKRSINIIHHYSMNLKGNKEKNEKIYLEIGDLVPS